MLRPNVVLLGLPLFLAPVLAEGQSLVAGLGFEHGERNYGPGLHLGTRFTPYERRRFALRVDLSYAIFPRVGVETALCANPCPPRTGETLKVLDAGAQAALLIEGGFSWTAGADIYRFIETARDGRYTRPAWNAGFIAPLARRLYLDMRYHGLIGPRKTTRGFTEVSLGVRL
jgi:hypothetical protein